MSNTPLTADTDGTNARPVATYVAPDGTRYRVPRDHGTMPSREIDCAMTGGKIVLLRLVDDTRPNAAVAAVTAAAA